MVPIIAKIIQIRVKEGGYSLTLSDIIIITKGLKATAIAPDIKKSFEWEGPCTCTNSESVEIYRILGAVIGSIVFQPSRKRFPDDVTKNEVL